MTITLENCLEERDVGLYGLLQSLFQAFDFSTYNGFNQVPKKRLELISRYVNTIVNHQPEIAAITDTIKEAMAENRKAIHEKRLWNEREKIIVRYDVEDGQEYSSCFVSVPSNGNESLNAYHKQARVEFKGEKFDIYLVCMECTHFVTGSDNVVGILISSGDKPILTDYKSHSTQNRLGNVTLVNRLAQQIAKDIGYHGALYKDQYQLMDLLTD